MTLIERAFNRLRLAGNGLLHARQLRELVSFSRLPSVLSTLSASAGDPAVMADALAIVKSISPQAFAPIFEKYREASPAPGYSKYLDVASHACRAVRSARALDLHTARPGRVLDIGTGAGYFPRACQHFGHRTFALDLADVEMYNAMRALLGVDWLAHRVEAFKPLPDLGDKFDTITAFQIMFDRHPDGTPWTTQEWTAFLDDMRSRLNPGGRIFLGLNTFAPGEHAHLEALRAYFRGLGGRVDDHDVLLAPAA